MPETKTFLAIYKVVRTFKHKTHSWIKWGRFVCCTPQYAKNHVIRRELIRCKTDRQASVLSSALWIDSVLDPRIADKVAKTKPKPRKKSKAKG